MPHYLFQGGYTAETWARMTKTPEDREAAIRAVSEKNGGKLVGLWFTFGSDDFLAIAELPDDRVAGAMAMAVASTGGYRDFRTTRLVSAQDAMEMMRQAGQVGFRPAGT
jgi:uncharacterized protein with GYD domain